MLGARTAGAAATVVGVRADLAELSRVVGKQDGVMRSVRTDLSMSAWSSACVRNMSQTLLPREVKVNKPTPSRIVGVEFGILGEKEILRQSRVSVTPGPIYEKGQPRVQGLNSLLMAPIDRQHGCITCGRGISECPGHSGDIKLAAPIYIPAWIDAVIRVLRCVCFFCSGALFDLERAGEAAALGNALLRDKLLARASKKVCPNPLCEAPQPKYTKESLTLRVDWSPAARDLFASEAEAEWACRPFTPLRAKEILSHVSDETLVAMGMDPKSHIKNAVAWVLSVPPPPVRPSIASADGGRGRGADDLTTKLHEIVKKNRLVAEYIRKCEAASGQPYDLDDPDSELLRLWADTQLEFASYVDDRYVSKSAGKGALGQMRTTHNKTIKKNLSGKEGRIRGNLMGKRVDFSARTVIRPDPNLAVDQVGVPEVVALGITENPTVNLHNLEELTRAVALGKGVLGGAETVTTESGQRVHLDRALSRPIVLPGMTVQRYLRDGDLVPMNRQPSLHRASMMVHRAKIYKGSAESSFGLNLSVTTPYNADFDGDEMNMHAPQDEESRAELHELMPVNKQIVSSQSSAPVMGLVHDGALGAYLMSLSDTFVDRSEACDLLMELHGNEERPGDVFPSLPEPAILKPQPLWTGRQILSALFPSDFAFSKKIADFDAEEAISPAGEDETFPTAFSVARRILPNGSRVTAGTPIAEITLRHGEDRVSSTATVLCADRDGVLDFGLNLPDAPSRPVLKIGSEACRIADSPVFVGVVRSIAQQGTRAVPGEPLAEIQCGEAVFAIAAPHPGTVGCINLSVGDPLPSGATSTVLEVVRDGSWDANIAHNVLEIAGGTFLRGTLAKTNSTVGRSGNSIVHLLALSRGEQSASDFLGAAQRLTNRWFVRHGFSVGLRDVLPTERAKRKADRIIQRTENSVLNILEECRREGFDQKKIEPTVRSMLQGVVDAVGVGVLDELSLSNRICLMKDAGSKGNMINLVQMMFCVGQQIVEGQRPVPKDGASSILPCYEAGDHTPQARAFVKRSLSEGLTLDEFYFYCMAGREGLTDTAVKTAVTGYLERRFHKAMESLYLAHDGRVRNSQNQIVQDDFGDGNWDPAKLRKQSVEAARWSDRELLDKLEGDLLGSLDPDTQQQRLNATDRVAVLLLIAARRAELAAQGIPLRASDPPDELTGLKLTPEPEWVRLRRLRDEFRRARISAVTPVLDSDAYLPFSAKEVVQEILSERKNGLLKRTLLARTQIPTPEKVAQSVRKVSDSLRHRGFSALSARLSIESCFTVRNVTRTWKMSEDELERALHRISFLAEAGKCNPGEMVGSIAAQSIGEPATQMTLNTFHSLGSQAKNVTLGIPRLKKLIETKTKEKSATVFLQKPLSLSEKAATEILKSIQCTTLKQVVSIPTVEEEPLDAPIACPPEDEPVRALYRKIGHDSTGDAAKSSHVMRFKLLKRTMVERNLVPTDVGDAISRYLLGWGADVECSETNMEQWVVRVRLHSGAQLLSGKSVENDRAVDRSIGEALQAELVRKLHISGIAGITGGSVRKLRVDSIDLATGAVTSGEEWIIDTEGTALERLLSLDFVDATRTHSNDVGEMEEVLGIEAAAAILYHELKQVIYFGGTYIDPRHIMLLVKTMTHLGYQVALSRFGINRLNTGPLVKASFEQTYEVLAQAALIGETDHVQGPTPSVMMGQLAPLPTGVVELKPTPEYVALVAERRRAAPVSAKLVVSVPRERPRKEIAPDPVSTGPEVDMRVLDREDEEEEIADDMPPLEPVVATPSENKRPSRKRARANSTTREDEDEREAARKRRATIFELSKVKEDASGRPVPPEYALFGGWKQGTWTPFCASAVAVR